MAFGLVVLKMLSNKSWQRPDTMPHELAYSVRTPFMCQKMRKRDERIYFNPC